MQAIVSDIIVNQAVQTGGLQISKTFNNSSSDNVSFADMLKGLQKTDNSDDIPKSEKSDLEPKDVHKVEEAKEIQNPEKVVESEKVNQEEKPVEKADSKTETDNSKKISSKDVKNQTDNNKTNDNKDSVSLNKLNSSKEVTKPENGKNVLSEDEKKALLERQKIDSLIEESLTENQGELAQTVSSFAAQEIIPENKTAVKITEENINDKNENLVQNIADLKSDKLSDALDFTDTSKGIEQKSETGSKISVVDLRTKTDEKTEDVAGKPQKNSVKVEYTSDNTATVTMELDQQMQNAGENILSLDNQTAASNGSDFQAMVSNQIQANVPDFVRTGTILLKDNNKGTINLVLHPDDLGNVKIHLSMDGKTVSAHITVNTKEALEVFKDNAQTLREAFAKNGYETASFDVSYNGNSNGQNGNQNFEGRYDGREYIARNVYNDIAGVQDDGYIQNGWEMRENSEYSINIVA